MQEIPKQPPGARADAFNLHKSFGLLSARLMLVRLGWRLAHPAPPLPAMPAWQARSPRRRTSSLYVALFVMPLSGYLGSVFSGYPVKWFGVTLPAWGWKDAAIKDAMSARAPVDELGAALRRAAARRGRAAPCARARRRDGADELRRAPRVVDLRCAASSTARGLRVLLRRGRCRPPSCRGCPSDPFGRRRRAAPHGVGAAVARGPHQRGQVVVVGGVGIDAACDQQPDDVGVTLAGRVRHRILLQPVDGVDRRAPFASSTRNDLGMPAVRGGHQRRDAVQRRLVDVRARVEQRLREIGDDPSSAR